MLSDGVGDRIAAYREKRGMSRRELAIRVAELVGDPAFLTAPALGNIETGRPGDDGIRRRTVSVDELMVLAYALVVPPILLLFPIGAHESVEVMPGKDLSPWDAAKWFSGIEPAGIETGQPVQVDLAAWRPITFYTQHDRLVRELKFDAARAQVVVDPDRRADIERNARELEQALVSLRGEIRKFGIAVPSLPPELSYLDALSETDG